MNVEVTEGDLLDQAVEVIVNAWNRNIIPWWLLLPQGVSGAIKRRGGAGPFKDVRRHGFIPLGGAVLTSAGRLPFKAIIHVAGINMLWRASERSIRQSVPRSNGAPRKLAFSNASDHDYGLYAGVLSWHGHPADDARRSRAGSPCYVTRANELLAGKAKSKTGANKCCGLELR